MARAAQNKALTQRQMVERVHAGLSEAGWEDVDERLVRDVLRELEIAALEEIEQGRKVNLVNVVRLSPAAVPAREGGKKVKSFGVERISKARPAQVKVRAYATARTKEAARELLRSTVGKRMVMEAAKKQAAAARRRRAAARAAA